MSGEPAEQRSIEGNSRLRCQINSAQYRSQMAGCEVRTHQTCPVKLHDKELQRSTAPNPNRQLTWHAPDTEQCPVRCTTRLSGAPSIATTRIVIGAINTPQPPPFKSSKFSELHIHCKSKILHSKTQSIDQILSKSPNQLNCLVT
jgi:ferredoxin